jgi:molybdopterin converting factor small subunit
MDGLTFNKTQNELRLGAKAVENLIAMYQESSEKYAEETGFTSYLSVYDRAYAAGLKTALGVLFDDDDTESLIAKVEADSKAITEKLEEGDD